MTTIYTDPKFVEGLPVTISPAGNVENETEERITNEIINSAPGPAFVFAELGAGYGRWCAHVVLYCRECRRDLAVHVIAVEPEPTHFQWLKEHMVNNEIGLHDCTLIDRPISTKPGWTLFQVGSPATWYGQRVVGINPMRVFHATPSQIFQRIREGFGLRVVRSMSLESALAGHPRVDLINIDIQGDELNVLARTPLTVLDRIHWLYIGTHSPEIEQGLHVLLGGLGWQCTYELPQDPDFGITDGIQVWRNPLWG